MDQENKTNLALNLSLSIVNTSNTVYKEKTFNHGKRMEIQNNISTRSREELREEEEEEEEEECNVSKKKLRLTEEQYTILEHSFKNHATLNPKRKEFLAKELNLLPRQVEVWFQNRRARTRLKQTEKNFLLMRRYYEGLTKENKRMQKEIQELKALKSVQKSPIFYMQQPEPATLKMCPSCKRIFTTGFKPNCELSRSEPGPNQGPF